eukprot:1160467-Pelagomonas_calceolata.AAC.5
MLGEELWNSTEDRGALSLGQGERSVQAERFEYSAKEAPRSPLGLPNPLVQPQEMLMKGLGDQPAA